MMLFRKKKLLNFEELMRKTIADIVSEASSVACWVYVQKYVKHKNPKRNAARIARRRSIHSSYEYLV